MEILQAIDLRESTVELFNEVTEYIEKQTFKTYVANDILEIDTDERTKDGILRLIIRFCKIEIERELNNDSIIQGFLSRAEDLYTKLDDLEK